MSEIPVIPFTRLLRCARARTASSAERAHSRRLCLSDSGAGAGAGAVAVGSWAA